MARPACYEKIIGLRDSESAHRKKDRRRRPEKR